MFIRGVPVTVRGVADANRQGVRLIHQELSLAPNLSVAENIFLGREPGVAGLSGPLPNGGGCPAAGRIAGTRRDPGRAAIRGEPERGRAAACGDRPRAFVPGADPRAGRADSSLSGVETEALFGTLRRLRDQGVGIVYISHRLEEIARLADRITVLRDGRSIGTQSTGKLNQNELVRWMVGREIADYFHPPRSSPGEVALEAVHLCNERVHDVTFDVRRGEILGIAGLVGSGRSELARVLFGIDRLQSGEIRIDRQPVSIRRPRHALNAGIVLVPEDRKSQGLIMSQSSTFNIALPWVADWIRAMVPRYRRRNAIVQRAVDQFRIRVQDPDLPIQSLSGGNQQKALVGRWMERRPKVLILDEPTRGVDVGAREEMFRIVSGLVESGMAVVLISSDLAEVINMSHRVAIYRDGRILEIRSAASLTLEDLMRPLTGALPA